VKRDFLSDPAFMQELEQEYIRLDAIAQAEGKTILEVNQEEFEKHLNNFGKILSENTANIIKKRKLSEKYGIYSNTDEVSASAVIYMPTMNRVLEYTEDAA